jgi:4a-hydroxytetrahydrobiopterin dehydratase
MQLSVEQITQRLKKLSGWQKHENTIIKTFHFATYMDGIRFVQQIAKEAEKQNHHPDLFISYKLVTVTLTTHDVEGITDKDFTIANIIESIVSL